MNKTDLQALTLAGPVMRSLQDPLAVQSLDHRLYIPLLNNAATAPIRCYLNRHGLSNIASNERKCVLIVDAKSDKFVLPIVFWHQPCVGHCVWKK